MPKILIIAEKPSVAADIAKALGDFKKVSNWFENDSIIVSNAVGHLVENFAPEAEGAWKLAALPIIPAKFQMRPIERTKAQFDVLAGLMARSDVETVVNACDAGREGELIFRKTYELAGCTKLMKRMWLQSMTQEAIKAAFNGMKPGAEFDNLADAARCRDEADWIVGINGTRGTTGLINRATAGNQVASVGRVQTPTLAIVVERENALRHFVPQDYFELHGNFEVAAGTYLGKWFNPNAKEEGSDAPATRLFDRSKAVEIVSKCSRATPSLVKEESKPSIKNPPSLFDLTALQKEANKRFKMSAKRTLECAQALYEKHKATTYPRTDSSALPEDYIEDTKLVVAALTESKHSEHATRILENSWVVTNKKIFNNEKISDHFAIIPTFSLPGELSADEAKIYDLIVRRFLAVFHPAAEYQTSIRITVVEDEHFKSSGRVLAKPGWLVVYGNDDDDSKSKEPAMVRYVEGEPVTVKSLDLKSLQTKPPGRMSEADLLAAMESAGKLVSDEALAEAMKERGLGTPATRAAIIEGLLDDAEGKKEPYLRREESILVPTKKAMDLLVFLEAKGIKQLTSPEMTGEWENKLLQMEKGKYQRSQFMAEAADLTRHIIDIIRDETAKTLLPRIQAKCPKCAGEMGKTARTYECTADGCGYGLYKVIADRPLSDQEAVELLTKRAVKGLSGFKGKADEATGERKEFKAGLQLGDDLKVSFLFEQQGSVTTDASGKPVVCPKCSKSMARREKKAGGFFWSCTGWNKEGTGCSHAMDDVNGMAVESAKKGGGPGSAGKPVQAAKRADAMAILEKYRK